MTDLTLIDAANEVARDLIGLAELISSGTGAIGREAREVIAKVLERDAALLHAARAGATL